MMLRSRQLPTVQRTRHLYEPRSCLGSVSDSHILNKNRENVPQSSTTNEVETMTRVSGVIYDNRKILAGKGLVSTQIPSIPVRFINLENSPLKIKEGTLIGTLEAVDEVTDFVDVTDVQMTKIPKICRLHDPVKIHDTAENVFTSSREKKVDEFCSEVPEYLRELFQNSCKNLKSNTAKKTLADVLVKHKDAFAKSKTELGSCSVLKHRIDTAHAAPVRQPL
ncbi:Hypothetical predicted protein [Mytilus galloprovincialis]|uniref:Uncharacterized protein n=1 Tax=Mytilus galloprovincialis TaxID=29158 RepID=A0A8B6BIW1_MYTGA|nr:Hypothetical predicted protein [Mytilus galloprovincialis]